MNKCLPKKMFFTKVNLLVMKEMSVNKIQDYPILCIQCYVSRLVFSVSRATPGKQSSSLKSTCDQVFNSHVILPSNSPLDFCKENINITSKHFEILKNWLIHCTIF